MTVDRRWGRGKGAPFGICDCRTSVSLSLFFRAHRLSFSYFRFSPIAEIDSTRISPPFLPSCPKQLSCRQAAGCRHLWRRLGGRGPGDGRHGEFLFKKGTEARERKEKNGGADCGSLPLHLPTAKSSTPFLPLPFLNLFQRAFFYLQTNQNPPPPLQVAIKKMKRRLSETSKGGAAPAEGVPPPPSSSSSSSAAAAANAAPAVVSLSTDPKLAAALGGREARALLLLSRNAARRGNAEDNDGIVRLLDVVAQGDALYFVFESAECDAHQFLRAVSSGVPLAFQLQQGGGGEGEGGRVSARMGANRQVGAAQNGANGAPERRGRACRAGSNPSRTPRPRRT